MAGESTVSSADAVFAAGAVCVVFDVFDDFGGDIAAGDFFDAEAGRGVDLEN